jgi:hypothetical protein
MPAFDFARGYIANEVPTVVSVPVAASQSLKVGDPVILSSRQVTKASGGGIGRVFGVMAQDSASQAAGTLVKVYLALPGQVWRAKATADATNHVWNGRTYDINSSLLVDVGDTTGGCIQIVGLGPTVTDVFVVFTAVEGA